MRFTQIIDFETSRLDEMLEQQRQWKNDAQGPSTRVDVQFCQDKNDPQHCVVIATFDSYEEAMENNALPETQEASAIMAKLANTAPRFTNLHVLQESRT